jgi:ABC-2 type transport system permease protein
MNPRRIAAVIAKEVQELKRDRITLWVSFIMPLVLLFLFGYAVTLDVDNVQMGVWDRDNSPMSRSLADAFVQSGYFHQAGSFNSDADLDRAFQRGQIKLALVIPERFHAAMVRGETAPVQVLVDGTFSNIAMIVGGYADAIIHRFAQEAEPRITAQVRVLYNPEMRSVNYVIPGLFAVILMAFPPLLTALAIVREKETGSIQQIFASPLTAAEFILGKLIPYGLIAFVQLLTVMLVGFFWFDVPMQGSVTLLLATGLIYVFCTVGLGLLVSTFTRSQLAAMLLALILTMMPSFLFSGFLFPIFTMPGYMQGYTYLFPSRYFVELSRAIVMKNAGLADVWPNVALLAGYTLAVVALAVSRFHKKVA